MFAKKRVDRGEKKTITPPGIIIVSVARSISTLFVGGRVVISLGDENMIIQVYFWGGPAVACYWNE